tara:strand:- start:243 stop:431 length:189 start_codon:yes stop_codon:yes gene_type:complete
MIPCAFGGQVGVNRLFPGCGTSRPGPFFTNKTTGGKKKRKTRKLTRRRKSHKSRKNKKSSKK